MAVNIETNRKGSFYFYAPKENDNRTEMENTNYYTKLLKNLMGAVDKQSRIDNSFGSYYEDDNGTVTYIKEVIYNDPAVVVIWNDGTKTVSKCDYGDNFNPEFGLILCVLKRVIGNEQVAKLLMNWVPDNVNGLTKITLKDVFKKQS